MELDKDAISGLYKKLDDLDQEYDELYNLIRAAGDRQRQVGHARYKIVKFLMEAGEDITFKTARQRTSQLEPASPEDIAARNKARIDAMLDKPGVRERIREHVNKELLRRKQ